MKKTHNNTVLICLTLGLLTGSLLAGLMINKDWFFVSVIFGLAFGIFYTSHGEEKIFLAKDNKKMNLFKKK